MSAKRIRPNFFGGDFFIRNRAKKCSRRGGYVCHTGPSRSSKFWAIIKDAHGVPYFALGSNFLSLSDAPRVGAQVEFTPLPPANGHRLQRGTEVEILRSAARHKPERIVIVRERGGMTSVILRTKRGDVFLDRLRIT